MGNIPFRQYSSLWHLAVHIPATPPLRFSFISCNVALFIVVVAHFMFAYICLCIVEFSESSNLWKVKLRQWNFMHEIISCNMKYAYLSTMWNFHMQFLYRWFFIDNIEFFCLIICRNRWYCVWLFIRSYAIDFDYLCNRLICLLVRQKSIIRSAY